MRFSHLPAVIAVVALFAAQSAVAQGFVSVNGRNHPELEWLVAETEHFRIVYPSHIAGVEIEAASIAETTYATLSANLGVSFSDKIRIYLSDEDEIVNGFAVPIGAGHTNIWVHLNDTAALWTGREKWLRKVVAHELAHIFHYRAVRSTFRPFGLALALPRFWTEGLAQYQTEDWDAYRGERWLRTAVLDDRLSYDDGRSIWNGRLLYSVGNAQVRYFATEFGDSALVQLVRQRRTFFPGFKVHDFDHAFRKTTGKSYREFYDEWRRHVNIQYNTIAGQMGNVDSLGVEPLNLPGDYVAALTFSADGQRAAAVVVESVARPISRLIARVTPSAPWRVLANGGVDGPVSMSRDGRLVAYSRLVRGNNGSLVNDLFLADVSTKVRTRLTFSRRASYPSFSPDGRRIAFAASTAGSGNVFVLDLDTGLELQVTHFEGDEQIAHPAWHPSREEIAYSRFDELGNRFIESVDVTTGIRTGLTDARFDDRQPLWSPDGNRIAFTSLRDDVPNVFVLDVASRQEIRATAMATGADAYAWSPADSVSSAGYLAIRVPASKTRDEVYSIPAKRSVPEPRVRLAPGYTDWTRHRPPRTIPTVIPPRPGVVSRRYGYRSLSNLTHVASLGIPYYWTPDNYGVGGFTAWVEPLGKHAVVAFAAFAVNDVIRKSSFQLVYINNQLEPMLQTVVERFPDAVRPYGNGVLRESYSRVSLTSRWPLTLTSGPFVHSTLSLRGRYIDINPLNAASFADSGLPIPQPGYQGDIRLSFKVTRQRPYLHNVVHPLDGVGIRLRATAAARSVSERIGYVRLELGAYGIVRGFGMDRFFAYGRVQVQRGENLAQDYIGLSRYDEFQIAAPDIIEISFSDVERVRGYQEVVAGKSVWFGSVEHRIPIVGSLRTEFLGLVSLGATTISLFADGALVFPDYALRSPERRLGVGVEVKNALTLFGKLTFIHAVGVAQPVGTVGSFEESDYEFYYRMRATVPF
jgi:hypothetical protein